MSDRKYRDRDRSRHSHRNHDRDRDRDRDRDKDRNRDKYSNSRNDKYDDNNYSGKRKSSSSSSSSYDKRSSKRYKSSSSSPSSSNYNNNNNNNNNIEIVQPRTLEEEEEAARFARIAALAEARASIKNEKKNIAELNNIDNNKTNKRYLPPKINDLLDNNKNSSLNNINNNSYLYNNNSINNNKKKSFSLEDFLANKKRNNKTNVINKYDISYNNNENNNNTKNDKNNLKKQMKKRKNKWRRTFEFEWDDDEDTEDVNNPYFEKVDFQPFESKGYIKQKYDEDNFTDINDNNNNNNNNDNQYNEFENRKYEKEKRRREKERLRNKHWSEKELKEMNERDWRIFREDFDIHVRNGRGIKSLPLRNWDEANLPREILNAIDDLNYKEPSPIQRQAIPISRNLCDMIGIAETGSGKTAAFLIPMLCYLLNLPREKFRKTKEEGPLILILAPTRELANQITDACINLSKYTNFKTLSLIGGTSMADQTQSLQEGVDILIGTPGRIQDCLDRRFLVLNQCNYIILDEADRMIEMGFEEQVIDILGYCTGIKIHEIDMNGNNINNNEDNNDNIENKTIMNMFTATMPPSVERIAKTYLKKPITVQIGDTESGRNQRIEQKVMMLKEEQKKKELQRIINELDLSIHKLLIFANQRKAVDVIAKYLGDFGHNVGILHGGKSQDLRELALEKFKEGRINILVATDVASRGLDISDITHVINYELPKKIETYSHRIGRTGRAGKEGIAISFLTLNDEDIMVDLKNYLTSTNSFVPSELNKIHRMKNKKII